MKKSKLIITWIVLIILCFLLLALNYIKFFSVPNKYIEEIPIENSTATAINNALDQIVDNFNQDDVIKQYQQDNINIEANRNNYSIYISYSTEIETITYEFKYSNLYLTINVMNEEENLKIFDTIYEILIKSCQKRIGNNENFDEKIQQFLKEGTPCEGFFREDHYNTITYQMNITKKIEVDKNEIEPINE